MFDQSKADRAIAFIEHLKFSKGKWSGKYFKLQQWQKDYISKLFGTVKDDGTRQYRQSIVFIPRKCGKTELGAAIALYMLLADGEKGAEVYSVAGDFQQASLVFNAAAQMVRTNVALTKLIRLNASTKNMTVKNTNSIYKVLSSEAGTKHGLSCSCCIFDEIHVQKDRELFDTMATSMGAREQPLMLIISTVGNDTSSFAYEMYEYAKAIKDGVVVDDSVLPLIYEADPEDDWTAETTWEKAIPNLDISVSRDFLRSECKKAKEIVTYQNSFRQLYLNQWQNQSQRWINLLDLEECVKNELPTEEDLKSNNCYIGLDLSNTTDLTSLSMYWPKLKYVKTVSFIPKDRIKVKEKEDKANYSTWIREGYIIATEGNVVDYDYIRTYINEQSQSYNIRLISFDPWNSTKIMSDLESVDGFDTMAVRQGFYSLSPASKELERLIVSHTLKCGENPVLKWAFNNVSVMRDTNQNIRPIKDKPNKRIDPVVATVIAMAGYQLSGYNEETTESIYEDDGIFML